MGSGSPTVLLESGLGADTYSWQDVQPQLGRTTRTCAYVDPPYVLVGQSYGGLLIRLFAHAHPEQTSGLVLVDAKGRDQLRRELAIWPSSQAPELRRS